MICRLPLLATVCRAAFPLSALFSATTLPAAAQEIPLLTGHVEIDLPNGGLRSDVCLSGLKLRGDTLTLVLNEALAIERITGVPEVPVAVEDEPGGIARRYTYVGANTRAGVNGARVTDVCLTYAGTFPVHETASGEYRDDDASSVVAFNGRTMRARGITRWHPTVYDPATNLTAEAVEFDLQIDCKACATLYVNGSRPTAGPSGHFVSHGKRELLLVAGELVVSESAGITFIGESGPGAASETFPRRVEEVRRFLEEFTGIPYGSPPEVVTLTALREPRQGQLWGFYSDPGLVLIGMTVPELERAFSQGSSRQAVLGFLAHELAHRYFGWSLGAGSPQRDFFGEPFATYLELKAVRHFLGEDPYTEAVERLWRQASRGQWVTGLDEATANDFAEAGYRYTYSPAMLFSLEERIGEPAMRTAIAVMLRTEPREAYFADFEFFAEAVRKAGVGEETWEEWKSSCLRPVVDSCPILR